MFHSHDSPTTQMARARQQQPGNNRHTGPATNRRFWYLCPLQPLVVVKYGVGLFRFGIDQALKLWFSVCGIDFCHLREDGGPVKAK